MKLPENYKNWIEFAKECTELLQKYPDAKTIRVNNSEVEGTISDHNINAVKAKAFDEVMELMSFSRDHVETLKYAALNSGGDYDDIMLIINPLITMSKCQR